LAVDELKPSVAVVDDKFRPTLPLLRLSADVNAMSIIAGSGSPEGVVEARITRLYMDTAGVAGAILYIKKTNDVAGNRKNGWILV